MSDKRPKSIALAILGVVLIAGFLRLFDTSRLADLLRLHVSKAAVLAQAEQAYESSPLADLDLSRRVELNIDKELLHYAQLDVEGDHGGEFFRVGQWQIEWAGDADGEDREEKKQQVRFQVEYDSRGTLTGFTKKYPRSGEVESLPESEALAKAIAFLVSQNVDTSSVVLTEKRVSEEDSLLTHSFSFTSPSHISPNLNDNYKVVIGGLDVTSYGMSTKINTERFEFPASEKQFGNFVEAMTFVVWAVVIVFAILLFIRRLRHDEIEFRIAFWVGLSAFVLIFVGIAVESYPELWSVFLGGGMGGMFAGSGLLIVYAVADSLNRDVWKEKLALTDLLFRGRLRVRETGVAVLNSIFLSGVIVMLYGLLVWLSGELGLGYLTVGSSDLLVFRGTWGRLSSVSMNLVGILYITFMFLSLWPTYLRSKFSSNTAVVSLISVTYLVAYLPSSPLRPFHEAFFLMIPVALAWGYLAYRYDLLTILLTSLIVFALTRLAFLTISPDGFFGPLGLAAAALGFLLLLAGVYLSYSKSSVQEFTDYVPEYVSRIAERERFLKELEIARSVQMRFLPASVPKFPHLQIASICRPALEVGGDYYDFIPAGDARLGVVVGDVSGKGVSAAFYMTMAKGIIKTLSKRIKAPKDLLGEMNVIFYENAPRGVFISAIYAVFDMERRTLTFARAGHNPLIVRKKRAGQPELLHPKGLAIGLERGDLFAATIEEKTIPIESEDVFVFFTDGISEAMNKKLDEFGEERLSDLIRQNADGSAQALLEEITARVDRFAGTTPQHDDFTMVVVKVDGDR